MSAVADKAVEIGQVLTDRTEEVETLRAKVEELRAREESELAKSLKSKPSFRPFGDVTSEAAKARRARIKAEQQIEGLERELPILRQAAEEVSREAAEGALAGFEKELRTVESRQPETWEALKKQYLDLVNAYMAAKAAIVQEQKRITQEALAAVEAHGFRDEWERRASSVQVRELPASWASALAQFNRALDEDDPLLARQLRESRPIDWISTGLGAALPGVTAQFGAGVVVRRDDG